MRYIAKQGNGTGEIIVCESAGEFIPRRSGTTGVGIHSPAVWHDGDSDFAIALVHPALPLVCLLKICYAATRHVIVM